MRVPLETPASIVSELARRGYNAERAAVTLIARASDPELLIESTIDAAPDGAVKLTSDHVRAGLNSRGGDGSVHLSGLTPSETKGHGATSSQTGSADTASTAMTPSTDHPHISDGDTQDGGEGEYGHPPVEMEVEKRESIPANTSVEIRGDITGKSTGTGTYDDFVAVFRDRYERLSKQLRSRVNHRSTDTLSSMSGGSEAGIVGMVAEQRSTANGHWILDLEDTAGTFPCLVLKDREGASLMDEILLDEVVAVEGTLSDDGEVLFVDDIYFPDVPRTFEPSTADRHVRAALISDLHVGSQEFATSAWSRFTRWLHSEEAERIEYLLIAGDMVEGVGVYPNQDEELDIVDIYGQYETFAERLKEVPGEMEIIMIPGNHDAVRLAEPQPGFDDELREIMSAHDARITGNPSTVSVEGVTVLLYHGVSLDEVIASLPEEKASYATPEQAMFQLLRKRHVAPQFGGKTRLAPEKQDHLVIEDVPDIFHAGHVHKLGYGKYRNVLAVNSGCWQEQTAFQRSVNIDPDIGYAPVVDLDTLEMTVYQFT